MTPDAIPITFRLLRPNKSASHDDVIKIHGNEASGYYIVYSTPDTKSSQESLMLFTGEEVDTYLSSLFTLLTKDADPFESLQVLAPGFPSIMLPIDVLKKGTVRQSLFDVLPLLTNFWKA
jgi:hypothetical protein